MRNCPRCGGAIQEENRFCPDCGLLQPETPRRGFPWRRWAIAVLSLFLVLGTTQVFFDRFAQAPGMVVDDMREETEEPMLGKVYDKSLQDTWEYSGGVMEEYVAYNDAGNRLTIYRDRDTGVLRGFTAALPAAVEVILSLEEARQVAEELARQMPFFTDPTLRLKEETLVDRGPDTERYYSFHWLAEDLHSGAVLLREIRVGVKPENGRIIYLLTEDGGEVTISTVPTLTVEEARALAFPEIGDFFQQPRVVEEILYVSTVHGGQKLLWMVVFEDAAWEAWARRVYVNLDAHTGEILEVGN